MESNPVKTENNLAISPESSLEPLHHQALLGDLVLMGPRAPYGGGNSPESHVH